MKTMKLLTVIIAIVLVGSLAGCSKAPIEAVQGAEAAFKAVQDAGAEQYAPESLAAANEALTKLQTEMTVQGDKNAMMRRYGTAAELAVAAQQVAQTALAETEAAKQRAHEAALAGIASTESLIAVVRPMLASAPRGKGSEADLLLMEADLVGVEASLVEARAAIEAGDFALAQAKAAAGMQSVEEIKAAIEAAEALRAAKAGR